MPADNSSATGTDTAQDRPEENVCSSPRIDSGAGHEATAAGTKLNEEAPVSEREELTEDHELGLAVLGYLWPTWKKWTILTVIFVVQVSMNFNASVYGNAVSGMKDEFGISAQVGRVGQLAFLIAYAFGCELWAPWSEEIGRKPVLQASLLLVNIWQIPAALTPNIGGMIAARTLGGLSSAGGSVTLGLVADMFKPEEQQYAVAYVVLSSVAGSVVGPVVGGFIESFSSSWRWVFWTQLIFGVVTQAMHLFCVPETLPSVLLDREAKRMRESGENANIYGPNEIQGTLFKRLTAKKLIEIWLRPFHMLLTEPIVLCLSLLSGFSDALIFTFLESYGPVFAQWNFTPWQLGLAFSPLLIGYVIAYFSFWPFFRNQTKYMQVHGAETLRPERRLYWLLWLAPLEAIGLFGFAWTSLGPAYSIPWVAPLIFSALVGIANYAIYMATIDYMVASYGRYAASATGGNGFARDFLAGVAAMYSIPFYEVFPHHTLEWPSTILGVIAIFVTVPIFVFYFKGEYFRDRSKFAKTLASERQAFGKRASNARRKNKVEKVEEPLIV